MPVLMLLILLMAQPAFAFRYETALEDSHWIVESSIFSCNLKHDIDGYGSGQLVHRAGESQRMELNGQGYEFSDASLRIISDPPSWRPTLDPRLLSEINPSSGNVTLSGRLVSEVVAELNRGMLVGFKGVLKENQNQPFEVYLSSVGFAPAYADFKRCEDKLLPASFDQLERNRIQYSVGAVNIPDKGKAVLDIIANYCIRDESVKRIFVDGHTDNEGSVRDNVAVSERRAIEVTNYLIKRGVLPSLIVTRYHGEKYPVTDNKSPRNRAKNRRTTIRLSREEPAQIKTASNQQVADTES